MHEIDPAEIATPAFVVSRAALTRNLDVLRSARERAGCKVLLALKGFAMWSYGDLVREYLDGCAASSVHEAVVAKEDFGGEVHTYAPAYARDELHALMPISDHLVFNSLSNFRHLEEVAREYVERGARPIQFGLRVNPEYSEIDVPLYDPCAPGSRLGVPSRAIDIEAFPDLLTGLHFHSLCEQGADVLSRTLDAVEARFAPLLERVEWVNMGGGHHITREGYDIDLLVERVKAFRSRWNVEVILEPGEAIGIRTGVLVASVLDVFDHGIPTAILDTSATAHMPDTLEMPYRPEIVGAGEPGMKPHTYQLGGLTCLAGDVIGKYSFDAPLTVGQKLVFLDMAHYTMVKTTNFNGVRLPDIVTWEPDGSHRIVKRFEVASYRDRLS